MDKKDIDPKDLMAVERATTALFSTAISIIILGFVIEKFELFLHLISLQTQSEEAKKHIPQLAFTSFYNYLGIAIVIFGILLSIYTYRYYLKWIEHLKEGTVETDKNIYYTLAIFISLIGILLLASMVVI